MNIPQANHQDNIGTARRFSNPCSAGKNKTAGGRKIYIEPPAEIMLNELNRYDRLIVCKEIIKLSLNPTPADGAVNTSYPAFMKMKPVNESAMAGNYLIKYDLCRADSVVIVAIGINRSILGVKIPHKNERNAMYRAKRVNGSVRLNKNSSSEEIRALPLSWSPDINPAHKVTTQHAAVNGMLNTLQKAVWLMGTHADVAFRKDDIKEYTLFHNPSINATVDFFETVSDKIGFTTTNAKYLAAVLYDNQQRNHPVKWVAHSQGAAIFVEAVRYHNRAFGTLLDKTYVAFHGGAHNRQQAKNILTKAGIKILAPDRNNPFDLVPNLAGFNETSWNSIKRAIQFRRNVKTENANAAISPHTLPFISLEFYQRQLAAAGYTKQAIRVARLISNPTTVA